MAKEVVIRKEDRDPSKWQRFEKTGLRQYVLG